MFLTLLGNAAKENLIVTKTLLTYSAKIKNMRLLLRNTNGITMFTNMILLTFNVFTTNIITKAIL